MCLISGNGVGSGVDLDCFIIQGGALWHWMAKGNLQNKDDKGELIKVIDYIMESTTVIGNMKELIDACCRNF